MYEWHFRMGFDRYIWILGMIYAYYYSTVEKWIEKLDEAKLKLRILIKTTIVVTSATAAYLWFEYIFKLNSITYNKYHSYTSWIPITAYICIRNVNQNTRSYTLTLFGSNAPDAQPKKLLIIVPNYPLLNFMLTTIVFMTISYRLSELTNTFKMAFVPSKDNKGIMHDMITAAAIMGILYSSFVFLKVLPMLAVRIPPITKNTQERHRTQDH
ncbi:unnamed protein product [Citrullus colocynthis]|uniref:Cas1p 10 TM acyl transferase domain-containing protein n=1 Tax=Citrullus colocynthis TaxID=252529 RepID=A0ABP0ZC54_9ROSI